MILRKALVLQDEYFAKNYSSFLVFTGYYRRTSGIFVPAVKAGLNLTLSETPKTGFVMSRPIYE